MKNHQQPQGVSLRHYVYLAVIFWTAAVALVLFFHLQSHERFVLDMARHYARAINHRDIVYRRWNSAHGGVYAPVSEMTPPNPHLDVTERDISTPSGRKLTLVNPAYMTRQVHELASKEIGVQSHITSLNPIRPENKADEWEANALKAFEGESGEVSSVEDYKGVESLRLMTPLVTEEGCLKCHAKQGYKIGDIRGGISVTIPMGSKWSIDGHNVLGSVRDYLVLYLFGLAGILLAFYRLRSSLRSQAEATVALSEKDELIKTIFETSRDAILTLVPPDWNFTSGNPSAVEMFQVRDESELISFPPWKLSPEYQPDGRPSVEKAKEMIEKAMRDGHASFGWAHSRINGDVFDANVHLIQMKVRGKVLLQATVRDVSKEKEAERQLRESEKKFRELFEGAAEGIIVADPKTHKFHYINPAICEMLGYAHDELISMDVMQIHPVESVPEVLAAFKAQAQGKLKLAPELPCLRKDGEILFADINTTSIDIDGKECRVGFFNDVTERKQAEEERQRLDSKLLQQNRLASVGTLARGAAHEINNPLNGIMNYAQLIMDQSAEDTDAAAYSKEIVGESRRIATIVRTMMEFAQGHEETPGTTSVSELLETVLNLMGGALAVDKIKVEKSISSDLPSVFCQEGHVREALAILVGNAQEALNERYPGPDKNKVIIIEAKQVEIDGKQFVRIKIEDHGLGIPPKIRERVFDPFFTTRSRASADGSSCRGLGLTTAVNISKENGGHLNIESECGEYTRAILDLPIDTSGQVQNLL